MPSYTLVLYHTLQTLVAIYTAPISYVSIRKVQTYEEMSEKAAKYSNVADHHLQTTRSTQAAGAVSILSSALASIYLLFTSDDAESYWAPVVVSGVVAVGVTAAHSHVSNYWRGKAKVPVPGSGDYNDAITTSNRMRRLLGGLAISWGVAAGWYAVVRLF